MDSQLLSHDIYGAPDNAAKNFSVRLKELIQTESIRSFARNCSLSETALRKYLNSESTPNLERLIAIANYAQVSLEWLATGKGQRQPSFLGLIQEEKGIYHIQPEQASSQVVEIEEIVLQKLIANTEKRLMNIKKLAEQSNTPEMWDVSIQMENTTLATLKQELSDLKTNTP